jgi:hypothetical protein
MAFVKFSTTGVSTDAIMIVYDLGLGRNTRLLCGGDVTLSDEGRVVV